MNMIKNTRKSNKTNTHPLRGAGWEDEAVFTWFAPSQNVVDGCLTSRDNTASPALVEVQQNSNPVTDVTKKCKRERSPSLNRLSPFSLAPSADQDYDWPRPPSPKRRTPRPSLDETPDHTPRGECTPSTSGKVRPKKWTQDEDECLRAAVKKFGAKNWRAISQMVPGRTHTQCLQHWSKVLKPGLVKGNWSKDEDAQLAHLVKSFAPEFTQTDFEHQNNLRDFAFTKAAGQSADWTYISNHIKGRTTKQCRERWFHHLDPSLKHGPFDEEEDRLLLKQHERVGSKWSLIASKLKGRTADSVKIRHITLSRLQKAGRPIRPTYSHSSYPHAHAHSHPHAVQRSSSLARAQSPHTPEHEHAQHVDRLSAPGLLEAQAQNPLHHGAAAVGGSRGHAHALYIPDDHPMHAHHTQSMRIRQCYPTHDSGHVTHVTHVTAHAHGDTPRPAAYAHARVQESWIDELARRLGLPSSAKQLIEAKCASIEREVQRTLLPEEREKVARVVQEACQSVPAPPNCAHASRNRNSNSNSADPPPMPPPLQLPASAYDARPLPSHAAPSARAGVGMGSMGSMSQSLLSPASPLHLTGMGGVGGVDGMGGDAELDLDLSFDNIGMGMGMGDGGLLRELQELDQVDLQLSTDDRTDISTTGSTDSTAKEDAPHASGGEAGEGGISALDACSDKITVPVAPTTPRMGAQCAVTPLSSSHEETDSELAMIAEWASALGLEGSNPNLKATMV